MENFIFCAIIHWKKGKHLGSKVSTDNSSDFVGAKKELLKEIQEVHHGNIKLFSQKNSLDWIVWHIKSSCWKPYGWHLKPADKTC